MLYKQDQSMIEQEGVWVEHPPQSQGADSDPQLASIFLSLSMFWEQQTKQADVQQETQSPP